MDMAKKGKKEIVYENIAESDTLVQADNTTIRVEFLNNGYIDDVELDDGTKVDGYFYDVLDMDDGNKEKVWSTLSKRAVLALKEHLPLIGKKFRIRKYTTSDKQTDKYYEVSEI